MTYCSPIWSHADISKLNQVQNKAMRVFLGVHKYAPIHGVIGDMGWSNFEYHKDVEQVRFWNKLMCMDESRITKTVFNLDYDTCVANTSTWCANMKKMFDRAGLISYYDRKSTCDIIFFTEEVSSRALRIWKDEIVKKPKL